MLHKGRRASAGAGESEPTIESWAYTTGNGDLARVSSVALEGWNGSSWIEVDSFSPGTTSSVTTTRTEGTDFTETNAYDDWRIVWTLSQDAANFCYEIAITIDGSDVTNGTTPTQGPDTSNTQLSRLFDDNNSTQWPNQFNVSSGQWVEVNIV